MEEGPTRSVTPGARRGVKFAMLVVAIAAVANHLWILALPFRLDDVGQLPAAPLFLAEEGRALLHPRDASSPEPLDQYRFRPLLWAIYVLEGRLSSIPWTPRLFCALNIALHAAAALLLFALADRWLPRAASLRAAILFAFHPAGLQALTWIAARGDLLATALALASFLLATADRARRMTARPLLAGVAAALAILAKDSSIGFLPLPMAAIVLASRPIHARLAALARFGLPVLAALSWRRAALGTWSLVQPGGAAPEQGLFLEGLRDLPRALLHLVLPVRPDDLPANDGGLTGPASAAVALGVALACGFALADRTLRRRLSLTALALLVLLPLPASLHRWSGAFADRAFYLLRVPLVLLAAFAGAALLAARARRALRLLGAAALAAWLLLTIAALVQVIGAEREVGRRLRSHADAIERAAAEVGASGHVAVVGPKIAIRGIPALGPHLVFAFRPPFRATALALSHHYQLESLLHDDLLRRQRGPIRILHLEGADLVPYRERLPALPAGVPALVPTGEGAFRPVAAVPARAVAALRFAAPAADVEQDVVLRTTTQDFTFRLPKPSLWSGAEETLLTSTLPELALETTLVEVRVHPRDDSAPAKAPLLLGDACDIQAIAPADGGSVDASSPLVFEVRLDRPAARLRFEIELPDLSSERLWMTYEPPAERLARGSGETLLYITADEDRAGGSDPALRLSSLSMLHARFGGPIGIRTLELRWRCVGLTSYGAPTSCSRWARAVLDFDPGAFSEAR